jgi:hypothetical protein
MERKTLQRQSLHRAATSARGTCRSGPVSSAFRFRLLKTRPDDWTPVYGRPFKCKACGSQEVTLFTIESQAELDALHNAMAEPPKPAKAPTTHPPRDPAAGFV